MQKTSAHDGGIKSTGIVRKIDDLGRVVLPRELRYTLDILDRDKLEVFTQGEYILLRKYSPVCVFCGSEDSIQQFKGKCVCADCIENLPQST